MEFYKGLARTWLLMGLLLAVACVAIEAWNYARATNLSDVAVRPS
jgi:hypothetical protein